MRVAEEFRVLGQTVRLRLIERLVDAPLTPQELADALGISHQNVSRHLRVLYTLRLVSRERDGTCLRYRVSDDGVIDVVNLVVAQVSVKLRELSQTASPADRGVIP
jgi:DNA-binding transcriptional ArsR family regulator